jgi:hypothetical protein
VGGGTNGKGRGQGEANGQQSEDGWTDNITNT